MPYVIPPAEPPSLAVLGARGAVDTVADNSADTAADTVVDKKAADTSAGDRFPVHVIYCVGRNYAAHAVEMGNDPDRELPFFFMKPSFALLEHGGSMRLPSLSTDVQHEVELVVAIGRGGTDIPVEEALSYVFGYAVGLDMTRRDLQTAAKTRGQPWEQGKTFLHAAPCSAILPVEAAGTAAGTRGITDAEIYLDVNGERRQTGNINQMLWKVPEVISRLSTFFPLSPGDLIYTGTPAGVGRVVSGDRLEAVITGIGRLSILVE